MVNKTTAAAVEDIRQKVVNTAKAQSEKQFVFK
jgi:hypothetical protein